MCTELFRVGEGCVLWCIPNHSDRKMKGEGIGGVYQTIQIGK